MSFSFLKVMVICTRGVYFRNNTSRCGAAATEANRFFIYNNRYRYHENTIKNKGLLSLVDICCVSLVELVLLITGTMRPLDRNFSGCYASAPIFRFHYSHITSATTLVCVRNTRVFRTALTAPTEPCTL